ncbi:hypothetical protein [Streptomyces sp. KLOTTS4A1]|uniref:hypothetical protein n=1 Tax=Streptomyces sp. KLOTTS4A1 TaxID=3390996 RepID=UPI0039F48DF8
MAHNPQASHGPESHDPAGSTQMFRAFVDEGGPGRGAQPAAASSGPRIALIAGVIAAVAVLAAVAWLALA